MAVSNCVLYSHYIFFAFGCVILAFFCVTLLLVDMYHFVDLPWFALICLALREFASKLKLTQVTEVHEDKFSLKSWENDCKHYKTIPKNFDTSGSFGKAMFLDAFDSLQVFQIWIDISWIEHCLCAKYCRIFLKKRHAFFKETVDSFIISIFRLKVEYVCQK